ncbi:Nucleolar and spindle-associated protein 1 [Channa argus]|uniref:Nucleolar and spindle-associated protein 1 n=1 Tax=Channa argus TaxID=215402 RepID=A0A6G1QEX5_CHAAH|nr:Nucleolar and spindle-associated protein 1 [Channa argus]
MDLDSKKYSELQSIAKELGLKANLKADKLLKAIKQHYQHEGKRTEEEQVTLSYYWSVLAYRRKTSRFYFSVSCLFFHRQKDAAATQDRAQEDKDATCKEELPSTAVFVNTRRGKGNGNKGKSCDAATVIECEANPSVAAEGGDEVVVSSAGAKKRKASVVCGSDEAETEPPKKTKAGETEQQPGIKDETDGHGDTEKAPKVSKAGKIPRYQALQQKTKPVLKPVTPNFKKLHEAHFNKMESIDSYVQRKTKQMDTYRNSVKELKTLSDKTKRLQADGKTRAKANDSRASMFSPIPLRGVTEEKCKDTCLSASKVPPKKPAGKNDASFRPSIISTRRINVRYEYRLCPLRAVVIGFMRADKPNSNSFGGRSLYEKELNVFVCRFSEATRDNEYKRSLVKTPARMSPCVTSSTPQKQAGAVKPNNVKTSTLSATKTPGPFIFTGNTSATTTPGTQKKQSFDLKASLSRPLTYKPHTGKLKPFGEVKENTQTTGNTSTISNSHQKNYKQRQVKTREDRRAKHMEERRQKKETVLGARRGLVMM